MTAVYGISVGSTSLRLVRTDSAAISAGVVSFEMKVVDTFDRPTDRDISESVQSLPAEPDTALAVTVAAPEQRLDAVRDLVSSTEGVAVVDDTRAALAFVDFAWLADGYRTFALVDAGANGSSVTIVDTDTRRRTETARSTAAAGRALDRIVVDHLIDSSIVDRPTSDDSEREIFTFARSVKESLSASVLARAYGGEIELMSRARLDELSSATVTACAENIVTAAGESGATIDVVVLVGGTASMPLLRSTVESVVGVPVVVPDEPEAVVAKGAGLIAGMPTTPDDPPELLVVERLGDDGADAKATEAEATDEPSEGDGDGDKKLSAAALTPVAVELPEVESAQTVALEQIVPEDIPAAPAPPTSVSSPYDSPTRPFSAVDDTSHSAVDVMPDIPHDETGHDETGHDETGHDEAPAAPTSGASMRLPRAAAMVLTALAVASGVLWVVVRPGADLQSVPAAATDAAAVSSTTTQITTTTEAPRVTTTTSTTTTTTTEEEVVEDVPTYVPPRTSTRTPTFEVTIEPTVPETVAPTFSSPTTNANPFPQLPVPPIFQDLPIPGF